MKNYLKLVNFELNRFMKLYVVLLAVVFLIQLVTTVIIAKMFMKSMGDSGDFIIPMKFSLIEVTYSIGFIAPIGIGAAALLFYTFFIWYRDWFSKNAFIYRLLTLPTSRMNVYFAKLTTVMLTVLGLVAYQVLVIKALTIVIKWMMPITMRDDLIVTDIVNSSEYLNLVLPGGMIDFLVNYGTGLTFVVVVFTIILLERSYRLKGIGLGILYAVICGVWLLSPSIVQLMIGKDYLYGSETFLLNSFLLIVVVAASLWLGRYLLKHKVTV